MFTIKKLLDKFNIKTEDIPQTILNIEIEEDLKNFHKGYKRNGLIIFTGEYEQKDENYHRVFTLKLTVKIPEDVKYDVLNKLEQYIKTNDKNIWESQDELDYCINILDDTIVEYYVSSKNLPTAYESYNIMGGMLRIS